MPNREVLPLAIIIRFDVLKETGLGHTSSHVPFAVNEFDFQSVKEALRHRIIITGGPAPHAPSQSVAPKQLLIPL